MEEPVRKECRVTVWTRYNQFVREFRSAEEAWRFVQADPVLKDNCGIEIRTLKWV